MLIDNSIYENYKRSTDIFFVENKKIDRTIGKQSFETLVNDGLLYKDYFVLTSTCRSIECYAKVLPVNQTDRDVIANKLQMYNVQLSDYIDVSRSTGIQTPAKLSTIGKQLFSQIPYSRICDISISLSQSSTNIDLTRSFSSNNNLSIVPQRTTPNITSNNRLNELSTPTYSVSLIQVPYRINTYYIEGKK